MSLSRHSVDKFVDSDLTNPSCTLTTQTNDPSSDDIVTVVTSENSNKSNSDIHPIDNTNNHASGDVVFLYQIPLEFEFTLVNQLALLAKNADTIFSDLIKQNNDIKERVSRLDERCVSLGNSVQSLNRNYKKSKTICENGLPTPRERRSPYRSVRPDDSDATNLFTSDTRPRSVQLSYDACLLDDQLARSRYDKYRSESSHLLDLEVTMAETGCDDDSEDDGAQFASEERIAQSRGSRAPSRPTSTGDGTVVPVDTTGTPFTRICAYRQSLRSASLDSLLDPKPRRSGQEDAFTVEARGPSKPIQRSQTLEFEQCRTKGRRRRNGDPELEFRISRNGEELDENYLIDSDFHEKHASHGALSKMRDGIRGSLRNLSCLSTLDQRGRCRSGGSVKRRSKSMPNVNADRSSGSPPRTIPVTDDNEVFEAETSGRDSPSNAPPEECQEPRSAFSFKFHKLRRSKSLASGKKATSANTTKPLTKKYKSQDLLNSRKLSVVDIDIGESGQPSSQDEKSPTGKKKRRSISMKIASLWNNMQSRRSSKTIEKDGANSPGNAEPTFDYPAPRAAWQFPEEPFVGLRTIDRMSCAGSLASSAPDLCHVSLDDTLDLRQPLSAQRDDDAISVYSMDTEGFYTSMHADTGIPSVAKPAVPERQSSIEDREPGSAVGPRGRSMSRSSSSSFEKIPITARVIIEKRRAKSSQRTNGYGEVKLSTPRCASTSTQTDLENEDLRLENRFSARLSSIPSPWSAFVSPYSTLDRPRPVPRQDSGYSANSTDNGELFRGDSFRRKLNSLESRERAASCPKPVLRDKTTGVASASIGGAPAPYAVRALRTNVRRGSADSYNHTRCSGDSAVSSFCSATASDVVQSSASSMSLASTLVGSQATKRLSSTSSVDAFTMAADGDSLHSPQSPVETDEKFAVLREKAEDSDDVILAGNTDTTSYWSESPVPSSSHRLDAISDDGALTDRSTESINVPQGMQLLNTFNHTLTSFKLSDKGERHRYALEPQSGELENPKHNVADSVSSFLGTEVPPNRTGTRPFLSSLPKPYRQVPNVTTRSTPSTASGTTSSSTTTTIGIRTNGVSGTSGADYSAQCGSLPKKLKVSCTTSTRRLPDFHSLPRRISTPHFISNHSKTVSFVANGREHATTPTTPTTPLTGVIPENSSVPRLPSPSPYAVPNTLPSNNNNNNSLLKLKQLAPRTSSNLTRSIPTGDSFDGESGRTLENEPDEAGRTYNGDLSDDVNERDVMDVLNSIRATINDIQTVEKAVVK